MMLILMSSDGSGKNDVVKLFDTIKSYGMLSEVPVLWDTLAQEL
jgi:hypothetical protein